LTRFNSANADRTGFDVLHFFLLDSAILPPNGNKILIKKIMYLIDA